MCDPRYRLWGGGFTWKLWMCETSHTVWEVGSPWNCGCVAQVQGLVEVTQETVDV